jgi:hypothetical protein
MICIGFRIIQKFSATTNQTLHIILSTPEEFSTLSTTICENGFFIILVMAKGGYFSSIVEFETREEALGAIKALTNTELDGRPIFVREVLQIMILT